MAMKTRFIRDLTPGEALADIFVLAEARLSQARNGPFWSLTLQDASGRMEAKIFSPVSREYPALAAGQIAQVQGQVQTFRDQPQVLVERLRILEDEPSEDLLAGLLPASKVDARQLLAEMRELVLGQLRHEPWRRFFLAVLEDEDIRRRLLLAPGAKAIHHAYAGGLLEHTLGVCKACLAMAGLYPQLDREVLLLGAALHDLGKAFELSVGLVRDYTDEGRLLGHIILGLERVNPYLAATEGLDEALKVHLRHLLVSHHGELEYGAARRPKTPEAIALHLADNLDAKLATVAEALGEECPEGGWSPYVRSLERFVHRPVHTPAPATTQELTPEMAPELAPELEPQDWPPEDAEQPEPLPDEDGAFPGPLPEEEAAPVAEDDREEATEPQGPEEAREEGTGDDGDDGDDGGDGPAEPEAVEPEVVETEAPSASETTGEATADADDEAEKPQAQLCLFPSKA